MSTETAPVTIDLNRRGIPLTRLVAVEWRKMFDTRAGTWLFVATGLLIALAMGITLLVLGLNDGVTITASGFSQVMTLPVSILLPVFAILTVTTEWGQRTNLVTFSLEPRRARVMTAKFAAVSLLALATIAVAIGLGALGNVLYGAITGNEVVWNVGGKELFWTVAVQLLFFWMAFAIASLLLNTPGAVAVFYVIALILPLIVYPIALALFGWARELLPWIDFNYATAPFISGADITGETVSIGLKEYGRLLTSTGLWIFLPGVLGALRVLRTEIK